jgi:hypothetical protein
VASVSSKWQLLKKVLQQSKCSTAKILVAATSRSTRLSRRRIEQAVAEDAAALAEAAVVAAAAAAVVVAVEATAGAAAVATANPGGN